MSKKYRYKYRNRSIWAFKTEINFIYVVVWSKIPKSHCLADYRERNIILNWGRFPCLFMEIEEFDYIEIFINIWYYDIIIIILLSSLTSLICYQIFYLDYDLDYERITEIENLKRINLSSEEFINKIQNNQINHINNLI